MPSVKALLEESETGPAGVSPAQYTAYRLKVGEGISGWLTGLQNKTLGPLWFPLFGHASYDLQDPGTVRKVDSFKSMTPEDIQAVYGSPNPPFPVEVVALSNYVNPHSGDDGTDSDDDEPDDVSAGAVPPDLPYMEVELDYLLAWEVVFTLAVQPGDSTKWHWGECTEKRYLSVGDRITLTALVDNLQADGAAVSDTTYRWHVTGAQVVIGTPDVVGHDEFIALSAATPRTVSVSVEATVTTEVDQGTQIMKVSGTRTATFQFEVLTPDEAAIIEKYCRLLEATLPIPRLS
jgi:hypothetical protein